jgi:hemoglobin/transferrin/lactoferrin receptor protein
MGRTTLLNLKHSIKMKHFLCWGFLILNFFSSWGQTITVKNKETLQPIEYATLSSENPKAFASTNAKGQCNIALFANAEKIVIHAFGYKTRTLSFQQLDSLSFLVFLLPQSIKMGEILISASRWQQSSDEVASRIVSISPKEAALQNPQTAADLLGSSGEVFIQKSQQGGGSPMIRGFSTNRLLYTVDGVRMNSAIFRGGNIQNVISLDAFAMENTEVLLGPGSVIYGSDAIGGVMSFQTLLPEFSATDTTLVTGKAVSRYSSANNEKTGHLDVNIGWKKFAMLSSITFSDYDDLRMGRKGGPDDYLRKFYIERVDSADRVVENNNPLIQRPTGYRQMNLMQKFRYAPSEKLEFLYGFHYSETSDFSRYDRLIETQPNGLPRSAVWNYGPQIWMMNNLTMIHKSNNFFYNNLNVRLAHQVFEESRIDRNFSGSQRFRLRTQSEKVEAYSVNVDFEKSNKGNKLFYGLEWVENDVFSNANAVNIRNGNAIPTPERYPRSTWTSLGIYANRLWHLSERINLNTGFRFAQFGIESDFSRHLQFYPFDFSAISIRKSSTVGNLGLVYHNENKLRVSLNTSTAFRAPNVDDIGKLFDFTDGNVIVPNPGLTAEYAYHAELNVSKIIADVVKLDVSAFYTYLDNALVRREFTVDGKDSIEYNGKLSKVFAIQNAAYSDVYGGSVGVEISFLRNFLFSTRVNYQLGKEEMEDGTITRSRHAAPAFGVSRLSYSHRNVRLELNAMYSDGVSHKNLNEEEKQKPFIYSRDKNGNPYSPSWYTLNFKAMVQLNTVFAVSGGVENITDQRYRPYSSGLVAPGRNFILSLRASF